MSPRLSRKQQHAALLNEARKNYDTMLLQQGGRCALCPARPSERRRLDIDHDHRRMAVRGLLCHRCNRGLASWVTPEWLRLAALYLEHAERRAA